MNTPGVFYRDLLILGLDRAGRAPVGPRRHPRVQRRHRAAAVGVPHHSASRRARLRHLAADAWRYSGGANAWSGVSLDEKRGLVYASTGSAAYDFYGANRLGDNLFANTILCLRAATGERVWHFQGVKHDIWDRDFPAPPSLVTITRDGRRIDVVAQTAKNGRTYVLDRDTGRADLPDGGDQGAGVGRARRTRVRHAGAAGAAAALHAAAVHRGHITTRTPEAHAAVREQWLELRKGGEFDPAQPQGTILFPGMDGGGEWGGTGVRPGLRAALRERERDGVDREARRAQDAGRRAGGGKALYQQLLRVVPQRRLRASRRSFHRSSTSAARRSVDGSADIVREGGGRMPAYTELHDAVRRAIVEYVAERASRVTVRPDKPDAIRREIHARRLYPLHRSRRVPRRSRRPGAR